MEKKLTEESAVFILCGITDELPGNVDLLSALKSWAFSTKLIKNKSLVLLFGASSSVVFHKEIETLIAYVDVQLGTDLEYKELIDYLDDLFGLSIDEKDKDIIKSSLRGLDIHQSEAILRESYSLKGFFDLDHIKSSKSEIVKRTEILEIEEPINDFNAIGGYLEIKNFIKQKVIRVLQNPERAKEFVIPLPRGILLFGPPGTGKTLFAKALAKTVKLPFINLKTENIYSKWYSESGQRMKTAIKTAEQMAPAIVFIDEIDRFGKRITPDTAAGAEDRRVFSQLLEWLGDENRRTIIIGTTNRPQDLDDAFIRTGRFDYKIPIVYPDEEARLQILAIHLGIPFEGNKKPPKRKPPMALSDGEFLQFLKNEIVSKTEYYTGAELEELVTRAKRNAFEGKANTVSIEDFLKSLSSFRIDPDDRLKQHQAYGELSKKYTDESIFL